MLRLFPDPEVREGLLHSQCGVAHIGHLSLFARRRDVRLLELWLLLAHEGHEGMCLDSRSVRRSSGTRGPKQLRLLRLLLLLLLLVLELQSLVVLLLMLGCCWY